MIQSMWTSVRLHADDNWTAAANNLEETITKNTNGRVQFHKYALRATPLFDAFGKKGNLDEIEFLAHVFGHIDLADYRHDLQIETAATMFTVMLTCGDIYDLAGHLARTLAQSLSFDHFAPGLAWPLALDFVATELENRFDDFVYYQFKVDGARWFDNGWIDSILLFDKLKYEIRIIDFKSLD